MVLKRAVILKIYYMPNGLNFANTQKNHKMFKGVGGEWKKWEKKLLKIFKERPSKL